MALNLSAFKKRDTEGGLNLSAFQNRSVLPTNQSILPPKKSGLTISAKPQGFLEKLAGKLPEPIQQIGRDIKEGLVGTVGPDISGEQRYTGGLLRRGDTAMSKVADQVFPFRLLLPKEQEQVYFETYDTLKPLVESGQITPERADIIARDSLSKSPIEKAQQEKLRLTNVEEEALKPLAFERKLDKVFGALDFAGIGSIKGVARSAISKIAKSTNLDEIAGIVAKELPQIPGNIRDAVSRALVGVDNADDVQRVFNRIDVATQEARGGRQTLDEIFSIKTDTHAPVTNIGETKVSTPTTKTVYDKVKIMTGEYNGKPYTTDSYILEFGDVAIPKVTPREGPKSEAIQAIVDSLKGSEALPAPTKAFALGNTNNLVFREGDNAVYLDARYYNYLTKKYPNLELRTSPTSGARPIGVYSDGELKGLVMPRNKPSGQVTEVPLTTIAQKAGSKPVVVPEARPAPQAPSAKSSSEIAVQKGPGRVRPVSSPKTVPPKEEVAKSSIRVGSKPATGKSARDLRKEVEVTIKKQGEKLKDPEIRALREKNLLGPETIDEIIARKRGIITDKEAVERAKDINITLEEVLNTPKGTVPTKEQLTAVSQVIQAQREINKKLVQLADGYGPSSSQAERDLIAALGEQYKGLSEHEIINRALAESTLKLRKAEAVLFAMKSEAGRTLQGAKQVVDAIDSRMRIMYGKINKMNALEQQAAIEDLAKRDLDDPKAFVEFLDKYSTSDLFDKFAEWATAAKLWNPTTHAVNFFGNSLRALADVAMTALVSPKTIKADMMGARVGLKQGVKNALRALTDEGYASTLSKYIEEGGTAPAIGGTLGKWVRTPFRMLGASDEIFRAIGYQRSMYRQAAREANGNTKLMKDLLERPTLEMMEEATEQSKRLTFQEDMDEITKWVNKGRTPANFRNKFAKSLSTLMRLFIPFLKTPTNLFKQAVDLSPLGVVKNFKKIKKLSSPTATAAEKEHARRLIGEAIFGTALAVWVADQTLDGNITGGAPRDKSAKDRFYREKKVPYAIKIGDRWYSYQRVDPFASIIANVANLTELKEKDELTVGAAIGSLSDQLQDKTYLQGFSDLSALLTGEDWERDYAWKSAILGTSPSFIGHIARTIDPTIRSAESLTDRVVAQIPFLSRSLPAKVDVLGQDTQRANQGLQYFFNPIQSKTAEVDPITRYLASIDKTLIVPQDYFSRDGVKYQLTPGEYEQYSRTVGLKMAEYLNEQRTNSRFTSKSPEKQSDAIDKKRKEVMDDWKDNYVEGRAPSSDGRASLDTIFKATPSSGDTRPSLDTIFK